MDVCVFPALEATELHTQRAWWGFRRFLRLWGGHVVLFPALTTLMMYTILYFR